MTESRANIDTRLALALAIFASGAAAHYLFGYYFAGRFGFAVGNDDAFITYRYAMNLAEHGVLSFNPGDAPPVEGFSNPLHLLISTAFYLALGQMGVYPAAALFGACCVGLALALLWRRIRAELGPGAGSGALLVAAAYPPLWEHATSGLETGLVFLLQVVFWLAVVRIREPDDRKGAGAAMCAAIGAAMLLTVCRTDGFVFPLLGAGWLVLCARPRPALALAGAMAVVFGALCLARLSYFGLPMPLPFYAKVSGALADRALTGGRLIASVFIYNGLVHCLAGPARDALLLARGGWRRLFSADQPVSFESAAIIGLLAYYLVIGGDIYRDRFLVILAPLGAVGVARLARHVTPRLRAGLFGAVLALQAGAFVFDARFDYVFEYPKYDRAITLGRFLGARHAGEVLATGAAGKLPYFSRLETIDMLGLNDRHVAMSEPRSFIPGHNKFDPDYIYSRQPDVICDHVFDEGSLTWGITRETYLPQGYRLAYLVRSRGYEGAPLIELGEGEADVAGLIARGYTFGCVLRRD